MRHSGSMGKSLMAVFTLSYGRSPMMVNRAPQLVQFVKGYRYLRSAGSNMSWRQSSHTAVSLGIPTPFSPVELETILNPSQRRELLAQAPDEFLGLTVHHDYNIGTVVLYMAS